MNLQVNSRSKERTVLIEKTITFYAKYLGINKADVNLFVFPCKSMRTKEKRLGCINNSPWGLILSIDNKLHVHRLISVLAHEMIHIYQYITIGKMSHSESFEKWNDVFLEYGMEIKDYDEL